MTSRRVRLIVLDPPTWEPRLDVPATRADCPVERPCPHVRCRWHLWRSDHAAGRPGLDRVPRDASGRTMSVRGKLGEAPRLALDHHAPWLFARPSCALDVADDGPRDFSAVGEAIGRHRTLVAKEIKKALRRFLANGGTYEMLLAAAEESRRRKP